jgi:hypothetical protein
MSLLSIELTKDEFNKIVQLAKVAGEYDQFYKGVTLSCNQCGAFVVKAPALLALIDNLMKFIDNGNIPDSLADEQEILYDTLCEKKEMMFKTVSLTDDEWQKEFSLGLPGYQFVYEGKGIITDDKGNPWVFISTDVVFQFDNQCECKKILSRLT